MALKIWPNLTISAIDHIFELDVDLESFLKEKPQAKLRFILLETRQVTPNNKDTWQGEVISVAVNPAMLRCLRKLAGLFNTFIEATCGIGHWHSAKHMYYNDDFKEIVYEKKFDIFYEYIPQERKHSCTQLSLANNSTTYFFLDLPASVLARFMGDLARDSKLSTRFFYMDTLIADEAMRTWQKNIALKRTELKSLDKTIDNSKVNNQSLRELHALAWEWHTLARNLSDYSALLKFFKASSSRYYAITDSHASKWALDIMSLNRTLEYLDSSCQSLTYLISDYSGRTNTQVDLVRTWLSYGEISCTILPANQKAIDPRACGTSTTGQCCNAHYCGSHFVVPPRYIYCGENSTEFNGD
ncbi:hypothetical protein FP744_10000749 [Trichoderma asperellum]